MGYTLRGHETIMTTVRKESVEWTNPNVIRARTDKADGQGDLWDCVIF